MDGVRVIIIIYKHFVSLQNIYIPSLNSFCCGKLIILQAQIDGRVVQAKFTLPERKKASSPPPKPLPTASRRDVAKNDNVVADAEKDAPRRVTAGMLIVLCLTCIGL